MVVHTTQGTVTCYCYTQHTLTVTCDLPLRSYATLCKCRTHTLSYLQTILCHLYTQIIVTVTVIYTTSRNSLPLHTLNTVTYHTPHCHSHIQPTVTITPSTLSLSRYSHCYCHTHHTVTVILITLSLSRYSHCHMSRNSYCHYYTSYHHCHAIRTVTVT